VRLALSHICVPKVGETLNGDAVVVRHDGRHQLIAVVDALGHGPGAALAAQVAVEELEVAPLDRGVQNLIERVHGKLHGTRGAAAMVCIWNGERIEGCSVGNVEMRSRGTRVPVMLTPGILGSRVRSYRIFESLLVPADRLVIFSDGISSHVAIDETQRLSPREACQAIMDRYRRSHDDATVLVVDVEA
jgi:phosphoserine phosphatase RsbX